MQAKNWVLSGGIAALLALLLTYFVLEPAPTPVSYGSLLGWSGIIGVVAVLIQGFRKMEKQPRPAGDHRRVVRYELGLSRWGGIHTALSIGVTVLIAVHAVIFFPSLSGFSIAIWLGAAAVVVLVLLNLSGVFTESKRKSRQYGLLKRLHVILMLAVLALSILHIELVVGPEFFRSVFDGAIIMFVVAFVVIVSVPMLPIQSRATQ